MSTSARQGQSAGRRRFWATVLCFAIVNAGLWVAWYRYSAPHRRDLLRVEKFTPGNSATVDGRPTLLWHFNLELDQSPFKQSPAVITPAVAGHWEFPDARTLAFVPDNDLPRATRIDLKLSPQRVRTPEGYSLAAAYETCIMTTPLRVLSVRQAAIEEDDRVVLEFNFSDRVLPTDLLNKLRVTSPSGRALQCRLFGQAVDNVVRVITDPIGDRHPVVRIGSDDNEAAEHLSIAIDAGLAGVCGPLGLPNRFGHDLAIQRTLSATGINAECPGSGSPTLYISLNGHVDTQLVKPLLSIEPAVPFTVSSSWRGLELLGDFKPESRYAVKIAAAPAGVNPRKVPRPGTLSVFVPARSPSVWMEHTEGYLGSSGNRALMAHAVNLSQLRLSVWRVYENNLVVWRNMGSRRDWRRTAPYSRPIATSKINLAIAKNVVQDIPISLDNLLSADTARDGVYRVELTPVRTPSAQQNAQEEDDEYYYEDYRAASCVVTLSDIALTAKQGRDSVTAWAVSLSKGAPLPNVAVRVYSDKNQLLGQALTDASGIATISSIHPGDGEKPSVVLAGMSATAALNSTAPAGLTWLDLRSSSPQTADINLAGDAYLRQGHEAFLYTDRGVYRPGETVYLRAIVRGPDWTTPKPFPVTWQIRRPDLREYKKQTMMLDADGAAAITLQLPADLPTGNWSAQIGMPGDAGAEHTSASVFGNADFLVEEYVPQRLKIDLRLDNQKPAGDSANADDKSARFMIADKPITAVVQGDYLFGRPAANLESNLHARLDPARFAPRQWNGWTFGDTAKLIDHPGANPTGAVKARRHASKDDASEQSETIHLNQDGHGEWELDLAELLKLDKSDSEDGAHVGFVGPWRLSVSADVREPGGRAVTALRTIDVDAVPCYIAARRSVTGNISPAKPVDIELALVAPDGQQFNANAKLELCVYRETWNTSLVARDGHYHYESTRVLDPVVAQAGIPKSASIKAGRGKCQLKLDNCGSYVVRLRDARSGAMTSLAFYVSDGSPWEDSVSRENPERLEVVILPAAVQVDGPETEPKIVPAARPAGATGEMKFIAGDWAHVLVRSPFAGQLLLTLETDSVVQSQVIQMTASQVSVPIRITDALRPNGYISASVVRAVQPNAKWRTHRAFGIARLNLDCTDRKLDMHVVTTGEIRPHQQLPLEVQVIDQRGMPVVNAAVTLVAIDEGILQLTEFATPDPLNFFASRRALAVKSADLFSQLMPEVAKPDRTSSVGGDGDKEARHASPVHAKRVKSVAMVSPLMHTDAQGVVKTELSVPEFGGKLRVMAVGYHDQNFGSTEAAVLVRTPVMVQSSFPRFAAPGDVFDVPLTLFNNSTTDGEVSVTVELLNDQSGICPLGFATGGDKLSTVLGPQPLRAGGQANLSCVLKAKDAVGVAHVRIHAAMGQESAEENIELPIRPASPAVTQGGYAVAEADKPLKLSLPNNMMDGSEDVDVKVTPWPSLNLPDGLDYLDRYPYGCAEQTISTSFPLIVLGELGQHIAPGMFERQHINDKVQVGMLRLMSMQTAEGGVSMWPGEAETWPWASIYAAHFIIEAEAAGHAVPEDLRRHLLAYARRMLDKSGDSGELLELQSYACYVLALSGKPERAAMSRLTELANAPAAAASEFERAEAKLFLSLAWMHAGRRDLATTLVPQTPPLALPNYAWQLGGNVGSPVRGRALLINAMLMVDPQNAALPALVQHLADAGRRHQWRSTQDTAFAVVAMARYLRQSKSQQPYDNAELWLGDQKLASAAKDHSFDFRVKGAALAQQLKNGRAFNIRVNGAPDARAYVSWLQNGVPLQPPADESCGLKVSRRYLDEKGNPIANNLVRSGDLVRVELTLEAPCDTRNLVIEDLLPAGLEVENPRLKSADPSDAKAADAVASDDDDNTRNKSFKVARLDIRDDRLVLYGAMPWGSANVKYVYLARAVAPGKFIVPPLRAECMYDIGMRSIQGGGGTFTVEPAHGKTVATR